LIKLLTSLLIIDDSYLQKRSSEGQAGSSGYEEEESVLIDKHHGHDRHRRNMSEDADADSSPRHRDDDSRHGHQRRHYSEDEREKEPNSGLNSSGSSNDSFKHADERERDTQDMYNKRRRDNMAGSYGNFNKGGGGGYGGGFGGGYGPQNGGGYGRDNSGYGNFNYGMGPGIGFGGPFPMMHMNMPMMGMPMMGFGGPFNGNHDGSGARDGPSGGYRQGFGGPEFNGGAMFGNSMNRNAEQHNASSAGMAPNSPPTGFPQPPPMSMPPSSSLPPPPTEGQQRPHNEMNARSFDGNRLEQGFNRQGMMGLPPRGPPPGLPPHASGGFAGSADGMGSQYPYQAFPPHPMGRPGDTNGGGNWSSGGGHQPFGNRERGGDSQNKRKFTKPQFTLPEEERCTLRMTGIPQDISEDELKQFCRAYGRVVVLQLNVNEAGAPMAAEENQQPAKRVYNDCLVQYSNSTEASKLFHSPTAPRGNRFIKIFTVDFNIIPLSDVPELTEEELKAEAEEQASAVRSNASSIGQRPPGVGGRGGRGRGAGRFTGNSSGSEGAGAPGGSNIPADTNANSNSIVGYGRGRGYGAGGRGPVAGGRSAGPGGRFANKRYVAGQPSLPQTPASPASSVINNGITKPVEASTDESGTTGSSENIDSVAVDSVMYGDINVVDTAQGVDGSTVTTGSEPTSVASPQQQNLPQRPSRPKPPQQQQANAKNNMMLTQKYEELKKLRNEADSIWKKKETLITVGSPCSWLLLL
jgi:hypothetical protein